MLDLDDMLEIRNNRKIMSVMRTVPVIAFHEGETLPEIDPATGEYIEAEGSEQVINVIWNELTSGGAGSDDITMVGGVVAEAGDAIMDFDIGYNFANVEVVQHEGQVWRVRSHDTIGLGVDNRHYVLLKRTT